MTISTAAFFTLVLRDLKTTLFLYRRHESLKIILVTTMIVVILVEKVKSEKWEGYILYILKTWRNSCLLFLIISILLFL